MTGHMEINQLQENAYPRVTLYAEDSVSAKEASIYRFR